MESSPRVSRRASPCCRRYAAAPHWSTANCAACARTDFVKLHVVWRPLNNTRLYSGCGSSWSIRPRNIRDCWHSKNRSRYQNSSSICCRLHIGNRHHICAVSHSQRTAITSRRQIPPCPRLWRISPTPRAGRSLIRVAPATGWKSRSTSPAAFYAVLCIRPLPSKSPHAAPKGRSIPALQGREPSAKAIRPDQRCDQIAT